jgi:hypothetical protein
MNLAEQTRKVLATLTPREEKVLRMRFGIGEKSDHTLEEVGQDFEVTRERIRQIEAKALRKLRHPSRSKRLKAFVERGQPERDQRDPGVGRGAHAGVDQQLDGAVGRVRRAHEVLEEPAVAGVDRHHPEHADDRARALRDEAAALGGERAQLDLHQERHRRDRARRLPGGDQPIELCPHRVTLGELGRGQRAHRDALGPRPAQLLAQAPAAAQHLGPRGRRPHRLLADLQRRPPGRVTEPALGAEPGVRRPAARAAAANPAATSASRAVGAIGAPATTHARPVSTYATQASSPSNQ